MGFEPTISCVTGKRFEPLSYTVNGGVGSRTPVLDARRSNLIRHLYYKTFILECQACLDRKDPYNRYDCVHFLPFFAGTELLLLT